MSTATKPRSSPSPGESATKGAPPCSGTVTSRSNSISRSSQLTSLPAAPSTWPVANSGSIRISLALEHAAEVLGGDRLGEGGVERGRVDDLDPVAEAALAQEPVGEEGELERGDRAFDRHVDRVDDQPAGAEVAQRLLQRHRVVNRVEGVDGLVPARPQQPLGLLAQQRRAAGDHQRVVLDALAAGEVDGVRRRLDPLDLGLAKLDPLVQLGAARAGDPLRPLQPERHEQQPRLVDVLVVAVDDDDLRLRAEPPPQPVGDQRAAGPTADDRDPLPHASEDRPAARAPHPQNPASARRDSRTAVRRRAARGVIGGARS